MKKAKVSRVEVEVKIDAAKLVLYLLIGIRLILGL